SRIIPCLIIRFLGRERRQRVFCCTATREAIEPAGFRTLVWQDDSAAAKAWITQLRAAGPPPSPNLGVVMGPDFAQLSANLGRNLMEGRLGILTAVFEAVPVGI